MIRIFKFWNEDGLILLWFDEILNVQFDSLSQLNNLFLKKIIS